MRSSAPGGREVRPPVGGRQRAKDLTRELGVPFIYKSSFDKANRSSGRSFRGLGIDEGLRMLERALSLRRPGVYQLQAAIASATTATPASR